MSNVARMLNTRRLPQLTAVLAMALMVGCGKPETVASEPAVDTSATFIGSAACQSCHAAEFDQWVGSHHEQAMQTATAATVLGDFENASTDYFGATTEFFQRDGEHYVKTANADGDMEEFRIAYTFGVEPLQQYLIEFPGGRLQTLAYTWDSRPASEGGQRWFHIYPDEEIEPGDPLHWTGRQQNWNYMCAECHSTNLTMGFDPETSSFDTTWSEISVGCESCHGPGARHLRLVDAGDVGESHGFDVNLANRGTASWVMNPESGIAARSPARTEPQQQPEACGRCHSRRGIIAPDYEYGEPLAHTHLPALLDDSLYFSDGQILDEVYVYGSFLQSRMYRAGVTCTDCHNPHTAELHTGAEPNDVCAQCHLPTRFQTAEHSGHDAEQAGCVDCHMTSRTYMVVDDRRDHSFRIPRPDLSDVAETPNACNGCHEDRDAAWAASAIDGWRPSGAAPRPHFAAAIHAGRRGFANPDLLEVASNPEFPGIARATAVSLLSQPFGRGEGPGIASALSDPDPLVRIATLRLLRLLPAEARLQLPGAALMNDPVRGVRIEAVSTYAGMMDLLPIAEVRAYARAKSEFRTAYMSIANRPEAHVTLATFELAEGNVEAALEHYETALSIDPQDAAARANLADTLRAVGQEARAETVLRQGLELDESDANLRHALGLSLVRSARPEDALVELRRAAELAPDNPRFAYVLGIALNSMERSDEAMQVLNNAQQQFNTDFDISMALATMRRDSGDTEGALAVAYDLARRHPDQPAVLSLLRSLEAVP